MIKPSARQFVRDRANHLCEYCHSLEEASTALFEIDHIFPKSLGGLDEIDNLALACQRCNAYRYNFTTGFDPEIQQEGLLFNPRLQIWADHFIWSSDKLKLVGLTAIGRATCNRLDLNDEHHNDSFIVKARRLWLKAGWHPPEGDPFLQ